VILILPDKTGGISNEKDGPIKLKVPISIFAYRSTKSDIWLVVFNRYLRKDIFCKQVPVEIPKLKRNKI